MLCWSSIAIFFVVFSLSLCGEFDFTVEVPAGKFQCYFQSVTSENHKAMEVDYQVIDGGDLNINFMILLGADMLVQDKMKTDGSHKIDLKQIGDYQICFDNSFSYQTRKVVFFEIFLFDANGNLDDQDVAKLGKEDPNLKARMEEAGVTIDVFHATSSKIKGELNKIEYHQAILRAHEARDRAIMSANLDRVTNWSLINAFVMVLTCAVQVYMIRSLFEENSKVGRLLRKGTRQD